MTCLLLAAGRAALTGASELGRLSLNLQHLYDSEENRLRAASTWHRGNKCNRELSALLITSHCGGSFLSFLIIEQLHQGTASFSCLTFAFSVKTTVSEPKTLPQKASSWLLRS